MTLQGKGFYLWQIRRSEAGSASAIANVAAQAGLSHVLIKIADGTNPYNLDSFTGADLVPPVAKALRERGISPWGWHYVYGYEPEGEAQIAVNRMQTLGLDGYVIDAETQYEQAGRDAAARLFMSQLRAGLPNTPVALSSYRFPTIHPNLPWQAFLEKCDYNMPQVYWVEAHNAGDQLIRCVREFQSVNPVRPIIPTGSAYLQGTWQPTVADINQFLQTARNLNLSAANFWEWAHTRQYLPELWNAVSAFPWPAEPQQPDILQRYITALNTHDAGQVAVLYHPNGVHVTNERTIKGRDQIRAWYAVFLEQRLPQATFTLGQYTGSLGSRHFDWTASAANAAVPDGHDSLGIVSDQIAYHYMSFTITDIGS